MASAAMVVGAKVADSVWGDNNPYSNDFAVKQYIKMVDSQASHNSGTQEFDDLGAKIARLESSPAVMMYRGWEAGQKQQYRSLGEVGLFLSALLITYGIVQLSLATEEPSEQNSASQ